MKIKYKNAIEQLAKNLEAEYETIFEHGGNKGDTREKSVIDFLKKVLPGKYGIDSGEVFDDLDNSSGQVDVIIYDKLFSTIFTDGTKILAPMNATYGIISCKSKMGIKELNDAIKGVEKYKKLERSKHVNNKIYITPDCSLELGNLLKLESIPNNGSIGCIYAGETTVSIKTIKSKLDTSAVDLIIIPGKLFFVSGDFSACNPSLTTCFEGKNTISLFILFLQILLSNSKLINSNIISLFNSIAINTNKN